MHNMGFHIQREFILLSFSNSEKKINMMVADTKCVPRKTCSDMKTPERLLLLYVL